LAMNCCSLFSSIGIVIPPLTETAALKIKGGRQPYAAAALGWR
jgi:hypothetical protein